MHISPFIIAVLSIVLIVLHTYERVWIRTMVDGFPKKKLDALASPLSYAERIYRGYGGE